jgi:hypothetical protein
MRCSAARQLMQQHELTGEQITQLRQHALECPKCALEIEGALLALSLREDTMELPSPYFVDAVMEKIKTAPVPGKLYTEHLVAAVVFSAAVIGFALVGSFAKETLFRWFGQALTVDVAVQVVKRVITSIVYVVGKGGTLIAMIEGTYATNTYSLITAGIVGLGLLLLLILAKPAKSPERFASTR